MSASSTSHCRPLDRGARLRRVVAELAEEQSRGRAVADDAVLAEHPDLLPELADELGKLRDIQAALDDADAQQRRRALARLEADWVADHAVHGSGSKPTPEGGSSGGAPALERPPASVTPERIGRYRVVRALAEGGFGRVYVARDEELARDVAIKLPQLHRVTNPQDVPLYLNEARIVAGLDHPAIVPVYDVGQTADGHWYVVSKLVPGQDLAKRLCAHRYPPPAAAQLTLTLAEALHYAHTHGLVHRDIKPANILLDNDGRPYVTDFGLALRDADAGHGRQFAGTPAYMSPEQARGEAHRVDARSDIFSLGAVLYELLTGQRPFRAAAGDALLDEIVHADPARPRAVAPAVPAELERICLKALSKRAADRYATARELADDLRHYLAGPDEAAPQAGPGTTAEATPPAATATTAPPPTRVVPKGLRAFDANDAEFFLELVPGPRDRTGLPEGIRRWKHRIEATEPDETFAVGVVFGPSGCGKSSLVRAGLLPRLSAQVQTLYLDATGDDLERRLRERLRSRHAELPADATLAECLATLRRRWTTAADGKLLLVIDQFEQWLHGRPDDARRELAEALRQCDGAGLQCLLLVRDDFWLALSRFMAELEIELVQGRNTALVDLFDPSHATKVLRVFGRAFGRLDDDGGGRTAGGEVFLQRAVAGLTQDGRVVPVRLALFAEMVKAKPWTPATLRDVGGATGVGVAFLEEMFGTRGNPQYRLHERAARAVFESLLPEPGSALRGRVRSYPELLDISGYGTSPRTFKELMRILDAETRLVTPVERGDGPEAAVPASPGQRHYQLTHDYLVPSLRDWLTKKRKSTLPGRAELRLAERSVLWNAKREGRQLPSLGEWLTIRCLTRSADWTPVQRSMMRVAGRRYLLAAGLVLLLALTFLLAGTEVTGVGRTAWLQVRARTAGVFLALGRERSVWPLLKHSPDPSLRTRLVHGLSPVLLRPDDLLRQLPDQPDVSVRRAMVLVAGELAGDPEDRRGASPELREGEPAAPGLQTLLPLYRDEPDPGLHAAAEWTLRRYRQDAALSRIDQELSAAGPVGDRQWFVTAQGHTLVVIPGPAEFVMGSPTGESGRGVDETPHNRRLSRGYAIAAKETTVEQFQRFRREQPRPSDAAAPGAAGPAHPQTMVAWYEAAAYCNWLSKREGLPEDQWCYAPDPAHGFAAGMRIAEDWERRRGFRLPTEAEWEYACRAWAATAYAFGDEPWPLAEYAVGGEGSADQPEPVGRRKPNDFGLFDMHGNVAEWCHDGYEPYRSGDATPARSLPFPAETVRDDGPRVIRGGSFRDAPAALRCAARQKGNPSQASEAFGFRVVRNWP